MLMGAVALVASLYSLQHGFKFTQNVRASLTRPKTGFNPRVCLVMPSKGDEFELEERLEALLRKDYDSFQVAVVVDSRKDSVTFFSGDLVASRPC